MRKLEVHCLCMDWMENAKLKAANRDPVVQIDDLAVATSAPTVKEHHHHRTRVALLRQPLPSTDRDGARNLTLIALEHVFRPK